MKMKYLNGHLPVYLLYTDNEIIQLFQNESEDDSKISDCTDDDDDTVTRIALRYRKIVKLTF